MRKLFEKFASREVIVYIIFGVLTTIAGFGLYALFLHIGFNVAVSNTLSTFLAILFAYVTNKIWVFNARDYRIRTLTGEFFKFLSSRFVTYVIDTVLLVLLADVFGVNPLIAKAMTSVIVVILNYLISKKLVFKNTKINSVD